MTTLILVRHGKTDWNKSNRIQGTTDIPLNEEGRHDAMRIADELTEFKIKAVYSSCLLRSSETAKIIAEKHKLSPKKMKDLNELHQGLWQGLCVSDVKKRYKKQFSTWKSSPILAKPPKGESMKDAYKRTIIVTKKILGKYKGKVVCLVTHEIIISLIKCYLIKGDPTDIWSMVPTIGSWELIEL
ncbi:MAG: histidine phosphatase family protein [Candidatus Omnitrophica bacterium]|nr:histidine phosphatase family protein [Candidatus Omnitrophota bacterium]